MRPVHTARNPSRSRAGHSAKGRSGHPQDLGSGGQCGFRKNGPPQRLRVQESAQCAHSSGAGRMRTPSAHTQDSHDRGGQSLQSKALPECQTRTGARPLSANSAPPDASRGRPAPCSSCLQGCYHPSLLAPGESPRGVPALGCRNSHMCTQGQELNTMHGLPALCFSSAICEAIKY